MDQCLSLLLGAVVHSPQRELFINRIKQLDEGTQRALVEEIRRVSAEEGELTQPAGPLLLTLKECPSASPDSHHSPQLHHLLQSIMHERDEYADQLLVLAQDVDAVELNNGTSDGPPSPSPTTTASSSTSAMSSTTASTAASSKRTQQFNTKSPPPPPSLPAERHMCVELAAAKAELRRLRNENDEREEAILDLQEELQLKESELSRLQQQRLELVKDARAAKDYRDEIECMRHKIVRLEKLEAENGKLNEKVSELSFYKSRVQSLKEDSEVVQETCRVMEEQLEQCQRKLQSHLETEGRLIESQGAVKSLQMELGKTRERIEELLVENGRLEREHGAEHQKYTELERKMAAIEGGGGEGTPRAAVSLNDSSLLAQLDQCNQSLVLELQLENRKLKAEMEGLRYKADEHHLKDEQIHRLEGELEAVRVEMEGMRAELKKKRLVDKEAVVAEEITSLQRSLQSQVDSNALLVAEKAQLEGQLEGMLAAQRDAQEELSSTRALHTQLEHTSTRLEEERDTLKAKLEEENDRRETEEALQEELAAERQRMANLLQRLKEMCNATTAPIAATTTDCTGEAMIDSIEGMVLHTLDVAKREADLLRDQQKRQLRELEDLRADIDALRKTDMELSDSENRSYAEVLTENRNIKEQVSLLQERLRRCQVEEAVHSSEMATARREAEELQKRLLIQSRQATEWATSLQVTLRTAQSQEDHLRRENLGMCQQLEREIRERAELQKRMDNLQLLHTALIDDYDRLTAEMQSLKQRSSIEESLRDERQRECRRLEECEEELSDALKQLSALRTESALLSQQRDANADEVHRLRLVDCSQRSTIQSLQMGTKQLRNALSERDSEVQTFIHQVEHLRQCTAEENGSLIRQAEMLLAQNHHLLLSHSDAFHSEQKELQERLAELRRQKERLEEKIMDQYKSMDSKRMVIEKSVQGSGGLVKRAARALISKSPSRKLLQQKRKDSLTFTSTPIITGTKSSTGGEGSTSTNEDSSIYSDEGIGGGEHLTAQRRAATLSPTTLILANEPIDTNVRHQRQASAEPFSVGGGGRGSGRHDCTGGCVIFPAYVPSPSRSTRNGITTSAVSRFLLRSSILRRSTSISGAGRGSVDLLVAKEQMPARSHTPSVCSFIIGTPN